mmetsp:Transcript_8923/g.23191  ORF Transcript_8923/g.23191 Transcript_8923/m.23191 type:complete len:268 (-) Transcript_8923:228-1031(-)
MSMTVAEEYLRVFVSGLLTCLTTGLGVLPLAFLGAARVGEASLAFANTVASSMMLAASAGMLREAHDHCGFADWQTLVGLVIGGLFIKTSEAQFEDEKEAGIAEFRSIFAERTHMKRALLIFVVMFVHSMAEGVAVGVSFDRQLDASFGFYVTMLLAIHNVPEGLVVGLSLVPRGVSAGRAAVIAILTSIPQPLMAIAAFHFVGLFASLVPVGLAFAAGAMIYVSVKELYDATSDLGRGKTVATTASSFATMLVVQEQLQSFAYIQR